MTAYLIDTHVYVWSDKSPEKLSHNMQSILANPDHQVYLSLVSIWELQIKIRLGKLALNTPLQQAVARIKADNLYQILPIKEAHLWQLDKLPMHHNDPFDRLLIAQAMTENIRFITSDHHILKYDIDCVG